MPGAPNELKGTEDGDATEVYDRRHGSYKEQEPLVSTGAKPHDPTPPFKITGGTEGE